MNKGDVVYWPDFRFQDGAASNKLLVVIGSKDQQTLVFRTTSQERRDRPDDHGCHADESEFRFKAPCIPFDKPTWVQYEQPYVLEDGDAEGTGAVVVCKLTEEQIRAVINCFKKSPEHVSWLTEFCG